MQVTKGTWRMREQCVPGSLSSSPAREPGNEASLGRDQSRNLKRMQITVHTSAYASAHTRESTLFEQQCLTLTHMTSYIVYH